MDIGDIYAHKIKSIYSQILEYATQLQSEFALEEAAAAHARMESSDHIGKIYLTI